MNYEIKASSIAKQDAKIEVKQSQIEFGTTISTASRLPNPAELFLSSFAACVLKNIERFSSMMMFTYTNAEIIVKAERLENPPRMENITYVVTLHSEDKRLNVELLHKNIKKHGTIYNTVMSSCSVSGEIIKS